MDEQIQCPNGHASILDFGSAKDHGVNRRGGRQ